MIAEVEKVGGEPPDIESVVAIDKHRERAVVLKVDLFIAPVIILLEMISNIDRGNIGYAATQGLTKDIGLKGNQLNVRSPP